MTLWELVSLELDNPAEEIGDYLEEQGMEIRREKLGRERGTQSKRGICTTVNQALENNQKRKLVVYGSGSYHHFTYGLCKHADRFSDNYGYIHFDTHSDSGEPREFISCGSFVRDILEDTNASRIFYIGNKCSSFGESIDEEELRDKKGFQKLQQNLIELPRDVYLSFDLDVMDRSVINTNFSQGKLRVEELMRCIDAIKNSKCIIGTDVLGYGGKDPGKELYKKIVKSLLKA